MVRFGRFEAPSPAHVSMVMADEDANSLLVVVPNDQLSLAIGRQGQNVRLASKLIGWRIDVKSEQRYANLQDKGYQSLLGLPGVDESLADQLFGKNIISSATLLANPNSWVTHNMVIPSLASLIITLRTSPINSGSRALVGSSKRMV